MSNLIENPLEDSIADYLAGIESLELGQLQQKHQQAWSELWESGLLFSSFHF